jgi:hypothetical protein
MASSIAYCVKNGLLGLDEVIRMVMFPDESLTSAAYPEEPRGGQVYVYDHNGRTNWLERLPSLDGFSWTRSAGRKRTGTCPPGYRSYFKQTCERIEATTPLLTRVVFEFNITTSEAARRMTLVHYRQKSMEPGILPKPTLRNASQVSYVHFINLSNSRSGRSTSI